jgi:hypothetical protein
MITSFDYYGVKISFRPCHEGGAGIERRDVLSHFAP